MTKVILKITLYIFLLPFMLIWYIFKGIYKLIVYAINSNKVKNIKILIDPQILPSLEREGIFRNEHKRNLVQITSHGESCNLCKKWENKVLNDDVFTNLPINKNYDLLSNAIKQGLFHNGCRHGITTYYPEINNINYNKSESNILMVDEETGEVIGRMK